MGDNSRKVASHDLFRTSRKTKEAALRRYQAVDWLECVVGPLGIPSEVTERDFISCLRNGIILCNVINKIQPGTISKVVENHVPLDSESNIWDSRPLPAYQYFENVRNFLVAVKVLKLPAFEASDLERENFEAGSAGRIADCILALKSYHEGKEWSGGNGVYKHVTVRSPPVDNKQSLTESIVKTLSDTMVDSKENLNGNFLTSLQKENQDAIQNLSEILTRCLEEKLKVRFPMLNLQETAGKADASHPKPTSILLENLSFKSNSECSKAQLTKDSSDHWRILHSQEKDLRDIKALWSETKSEFENLQNQLMNDLNHLGSLVKEMSNHACGYQEVIHENRKLYNMVQDLKGNIRVYCRIRPMLNAEAKNVISVQGEDGTLVVSDPSKLLADGQREYQFTRVYSPNATQDELFKDTQPLIRSVMDGYNVCILAYGQTRSGKSYTMYGPSGGSEKEMGINFFALNDLFQTITMRKYLITYELHLQMVEICNEHVKDLLAEVSEQQDELSLPNITSHTVQSSTEAINLVKLGQERRIGKNSSETTKQSNSSQSVVIIHVQGKDLSGKVLHGHLHLVDLAGSGEEDKSLSCLEDVITSLLQKKSNIHYRDSKLTTLLQDSLGGKAKILVFAHVIPEDDSFTKTLSTLKFAQRISAIELGAPQANKTYSEVMELKNEIESLKRALGDKIACTPQTIKQPKSPRDNTRVIPSQRVPVKSRRLSLENREKSTMAPPQTSRRIRRLSLEAPKVSPVSDVNGPTFIDCASPSGLNEPKLPRDKTACTPQPTKQPKSPRDNARVIPPQRIPVKTRRLSLENREKSAMAPPPTSRRVRRLSLEAPKVPPPSDLNGLTFIDCASKIPSQQSKTPEQLNCNQHVKHPGDNISSDTQTPGISKSTNRKGSQIKKSLKTIGKLINGSEKKNQEKLESTSAKPKDVANGSEKRSSRRHSLTGNLPPAKTTRRTSLGGISNDLAKRWV